MQRLLADVALGRQSIKGSRSHLSLELYVKLIQQIGFRCEVGKE
jgi:hypothetical protein